MKSFGSLDIEVEEGKGGLFNIAGRVGPTTLRIRGYVHEDDELLVIGQEIESSMGPVSLFAIFVQSINDIKLEPGEGSKSKVVILEMTEAAFTVENTGEIITVGGTLGVELEHITDLAQLRTEETN